MLPGHPALSQACQFALLTIKKRRDFQAASSGMRFVCPCFTLLRRVALKIKNGSGEANTLFLGSDVISSKAGGVVPCAPLQRIAFRFGFTVTKKLGNAVVRNRIRRRLKAAVVEAMRNASLTTDQCASPLDFVVLARHAALTYSYSELVADFTRAIEKLATAPLDAKPASKLQRPNISPISAYNKKEGLAKPPPFA